MSEPVARSDEHTSLRFAAAIFAATLMYYVFARTAELRAGGLLWTPWGVGTVGSIFSAAFAFYAISPPRLEPAARRLGLDPYSWSHLFAASLMSLALFVIIGIGIVGETLFNYEATTRLGRDFSELVQPSASDIVFALLLNFVLYLVPIVAWVRLVDGQGGVALLRSLGLVTGRLGNRLLLGLSATIVIFGALGVLGLLLYNSGVETPTNPRALQIASALDVRSAFLVAALAAVGEEVFFRGFLQQRIGLVGQAVFFGLAHASYLNALQVIITFVLALGYGLIRRRTGDVVAPIFSHFLFDFVMILSVVYVAGDGGVAVQLS